VYAEGGGRLERNPKKGKKNPGEDHYLKPYKKNI
jgi:hypothetical protein